MPLSLIRSKKKDGLKKAAALLKRDNNNSYPPEGGNNHHNNVSSPSSPSSHEIINLTSEAGLMVNKARSKGPRLGLGGMSNSLLFEEDPGIMSEAETSSTGFLPPYGSNGGGNRRSAKFKTSLAGLGPMYPPQPEDDPGIMSEAETSSTARVKRSNRGRNSIPMGSLTLQRSSLLAKKPATVCLLNGPYLSANTPGKGGNLFEDDPGIMSEAETSSTGGMGRRNRLSGKKSSSSSSKNTLPVVRTPSKTLERPLGLVFLIYRGETKRALLPNEITSKDTVKALFVRSFGKSLTMEYMDSPRVKIYIHDSAKDIFYELENLGEIKDRSVLKLFEADSSGRGPGGLGPGGLPPITNKDEVQDHGPIDGFITPDAYSTKPQVLKMSGKFPPERSTTLPRNAFSALGLPLPNAAPSPDHQSIPLLNAPRPVGILRPESALGERSKTLGPGFMRGYGRGSSFASSPESNYEDQVPRSRFSSIPEGRYYPGPGSTEEAKARMMHMEAQLSQLTGMVEKALKNKKAGVSAKKTVSFEKSVTFSDEVSPGILSSSKRSNNVIAPSQPSLHSQLGILQKSTRELRQEVRVLRRLTQLQSMAMKDLVQDTYLKLREACIAFSGSVMVGNESGSSEDLEHLRITQDDEIFSTELNALLSNLSSLEVRVEDMRSGVIAKKNKISLMDVENMAVSLSQCSKAVTQLKMAYPALEARVGKEGPAQKKIPERIDNAWRRCKKLTGTLVTLKRLASVQEQRFNPGAVPMDVTSLSPLEMSRYNNNGPPKEPEINTKDSSLDDLLDALQSYNKEGGSSPASTLKHTSSKLVVPVPAAVKTNALSNEEVAELSPLKKSSTPNSSTPNNTVTSGGKKGKSTKGTPPPPPPRTSSALKQPITRAESASGYLSSSSLKSGETSSSSESINSQEGVSNIVMLRKANSVTGPPVPLKPMDLKSLTTKSRQDALETRHQELLSRQKQLQEQYQRLQQMQENNKNKQQQQLQGKTNEVKDSGASVKETVKAFNSKAGGKGVPPPLPQRGNSVLSEKAPEKTTALSPGQAAEETEEERRGTEGEEVVKAENESKSSTKIYETDII